MRLNALLLLSLSCALAGCGSSSSSSTPAVADSSSDAAQDGASDTSTDASTEASSETSSEAAGDVASGTFACGGKTCTFPGEYCRVDSGGPAGSTTTYACKPAPAACAGVATCACIDAEMKASCGTSPGSTMCKARDGGIQADCLRA